MTLLLIKDLLDSQCKKLHFYIGGSTGTHTLLTNIGLAGRPQRQAPRAGEEEERSL